MKWSFEFYGTGLLYNQSADRGSQLCLRSAMVSDQFMIFAVVWSQRPQWMSRKQHRQVDFIWRKYIMNKIWLDFYDFIESYNWLYLKNRNIVFGIVCPTVSPVNLIVCQNMYTVNGGNKRAYNIYCKTRRSKNVNGIVDTADVPLGRLSTVVASDLRSKNKPTFTQTLIQVTFGASHSFDFPHDISPEEGMLKELNSMLPLDCEGHRLQDRQWWLFIPALPPTASAICIIVSRSRTLPILSNVSTRDITSITLDIKRIEEAMPDVVGTHMIFQVL